MKNIKTRIAAWVVAGTMISSLTACESEKKEHLKYKIDEETGIEKLFGKDVDVDGLDDYYIIELIPAYIDERHLYLSVTSVNYTTGSPYYLNYYSWHSLKEDLILAKGYDAIGEISMFDYVTSNYGKVANIFEIKNIVIKYKGLKKTYSAEEIEDVFESFKNDYSSFDFDASRVYHNEELDKEYANNKILIKK